MQTEESVSVACLAPYDPMLDRTAEIVMAYVGRNAVPVGEVPGLIASVHGALVGLTQPQRATEPGVAKPSPAEIRKSILPECIVSFIDGKGYKSMRRHLNKHGLTPEGYRARYGLPVDYPIVSAEYSAARSAISKAMGLGRKQQAEAPADLQAAA